MDKPPLTSAHPSQIPERGESVAHCGHGVKRELPSYRHVRIWAMNCGEVRCSLSEHDFFQPQHINEFIDAALDGRNLPAEWHSLNRAEVLKAQKAEADSRRAPASTDLPGQANGGSPK
jgi:hypothetical protein